MSEAAMRGVKIKMVEGRCACGSGFSIPEYPTDVRREYEASFWRSHSGAGHGERQVGDDPNEAQGSLL